MAIDQDTVVQKHTTITTPTHTILDNTHGHHPHSHKRVGCMLFEANLIVPTIRLSYSKVLAAWYHAIHETLEAMDGILCNMHFFASRRSCNVKRCGSRLDSMAIDDIKTQIDDHIAESQA